MSTTPEKVESPFVPGMERPLYTSAHMRNAWEIVYTTTDCSIQVFPEFNTEVPIDIGPFSPTGKNFPVSREALLTIIMLIELLTGFEFKRVNEGTSKYIFRRTTKSYEGRHSHQ